MIWCVSCCFGRVRGRVSLPGADDSKRTYGAIGAKHAADVRRKITCTLAALLLLPHGAAALRRRPAAAELGRGSRQAPEA